MLDVWGQGLGGTRYTSRYIWWYSNKIPLGANKIPLG